MLIHILLYYYVICTVLWPILDLYLMLLEED